MAHGLRADTGSGTAAVTASIGLACDKGRHGLTAESLVEHAQAELERARDAGGNCAGRWVHPMARERMPAISGDLSPTSMSATRRITIPPSFFPEEEDQTPGGKDGPP